MFHGISGFVVLVCRTNGNDCAGFRSPRSLEPTIVHVAAAVSMKNFVKIYWDVWPVLFDIFLSETH